MVELGAARGAFEGWLDRGRHGAPIGPGVRIEARDGVEMALVLARRGKALEVIARIKEIFGLEIADRPGRFGGDGLAFIGVAPGQWLAVSVTPDSLEERLTGALRGLAGVSSQSDGRALVRVGGASARDVLAKGAPLDLHPAVFGPGAAASTQIALIAATLWQIDDAPTYEIAVPRSMAGDFAHWLLASAAEYGAEVI